MNAREQAAQGQPIAQGTPIEQAVAHHQAGRIADAERLYRDVLAREPGNLDALHLLGVIAAQRGRGDEAVELISQSLAGHPDNFHALNHLGEAYRSQGLVDEAKTCFERALDLKDDYFQAYNNLGNVYQASGRLELAMGCYRKAIEINPKYAESQLNLGNALQESGQFGAAVACYRQALELRPELVEASFNMGNVYKTLRRYDDAITHYRNAIELRPDFAEAHLALARSYHEIADREQAMASFNRVCELRPNDCEARWGMVFTQLALVHDDPAAVDHYRRAFAQGLSELEHWFESDDERIMQGFNAIGTQQPFYLAYEEENNRELLKQYGRLCARLAEPWQREQRLVLRPHKRGKRVRVGIASAHVSDHSVWHAIVKGWCRQLDRDRFDVRIFSLGKITDRETELAKGYASRFEAGLVRPQQWAEAILGDALDVLIYPEIGMDPMTAKLANLRLAPVQMTTWGHPETSGLETIDYYISAADFEPENAQNNYAERLITLPNLGCYYEPLDIAREDIALESLGIDPSAPLFICPGTPFKYAPRHDWIFPAIAKRVSRSQFAFFKYPLENVSKRFTQRLQASFHQAGLDYRDHVIEIEWLSKPRFASLMRQATVYLDTIGFSGFNTAMQAIEAGLPVVTREGRFLRGRLASGILKRIGMTELVPATDAGYVDSAARLALDPKLRDSLCRRLEGLRTELYRDTRWRAAMESCLAGAISGKPSAILR